MADRYLLESGAPDGYLLEDGTGVLLLEVTTFDPTKLGHGGAFTSLSNGNLTATSVAGLAGDFGNAGVTSSKSSGKYTYSFIFDSAATGADTAFGFGDAAFDWAGITQFFSSAHTIAWRVLGDGTAAHSLQNGSTFVDLTTINGGGWSQAIGGVGHEHHILIDIDNLKLYLAIDGSPVFGMNPAAGSGGISIAISTPFTPGLSHSDVNAATLKPSPTYLPGSFLPWDPSSSVTHATTGALTGPGSTIAGTAAHIAIHGTSGVLTGPGSTVAGTAAHIAIHPTSGALTGAGSTIVGSAARTAVHTTTGVLVGQGSTIAGVAVYNAKHTTTGVLTGAGSVVVGASARTRAHATTGVLTGPGSTIAGTAVYNAKHTTSGALTGPGSTVAGTAARFRAFAASGALVGPGSTIVGAALRGTISTTHATSGALIGQPSIILGTAGRMRQHATSGVLVGPPALLVGVNTRWRDHGSSGALLGVTGVVFGRAFNGTPQLHDIPIDSDNLTDEPAPPSANLGSITEPSGQIVNHPPYPPA